MAPSSMWSSLNGSPFTAWKFLLICTTRAGVKRRRRRRAADRRHTHLHQTVAVVVVLSSAVGMKLPSSIRLFGDHGGDQSRVEVEPVDHSLVKQESPLNLEATITRGFDATKLRSPCPPRERAPSRATPTRERSLQLTCSELTFVRHSGFGSGIWTYPSDLSLPTFWILPHQELVLLEIKSIQLKEQLLFNR